MIPVYGFLEGDTLGLLMLADPDETVAALARRLEASAAVRVAPRAALRAFRGERELPWEGTVRQAGLEPLDRLDVRGA